MDTPVKQAYDDAVALRYMPFGGARVYAPWSAGPKPHPSLAVCEAGVYAT
ncbi:MAG: hypothetical protein JKY34_10485 [Kordiimonadaceae bacterium]|nr:hypothetical protein [Kordiimonadaceae bacterium]